MDRIFLPTLAICNLLSLYIKHYVEGNCKITLLLSTHILLKIPLFVHFVPLHELLSVLLLIVSLNSCFKMSYFFIIMLKLSLIQMCVTARKIEFHD